MSCSGIIEPSTFTVNNASPNVLLDSKVVLFYG